MDDPIWHERCARYYSLCDKYLRRGVLVAVHTVQRILRSVKGEFRGVVATIRDRKLALEFIRLREKGCNYSQETLAHVHNGLDRRSGCGLIDD